MTENTDYLTGIRGLAALIVLAGHISNTGHHLIPGLDLRATAKAGVWLFFILSAYLLTTKFIVDADRYSPGWALWRYMIRRLFRIMPTYIVFLTALLSLEMIDGPSFINHALLIQGDGHLWTIPVEMKFYLVLPLFAGALIMAPVGSRVWMAVSFLMLSVALYYAVGPSEIAQNTVSLMNYVPFFAMGVLLAVLPTKSYPWMLGWTGLAALALLNPRTLMGVFGINFQDALTWSWLFSVAWGAVMLGARTGSLRTGLSARPLLFLGNISFSLYLVHFAIVAYIAGHFDFGYATGALMFALSMVVSYPLYRWVEVPFRDLGYWLTRTQSSSNYEASIAPLDNR